MKQAPTIARLFVAVPVNSKIARPLTSIAPARQTGVRSIDEHDLHITLHFLGKGEIEAVSRALRSVSVTRFSVNLDRPGHFSLPGQRTILWVGVALSAELVELHAQIARALEVIGFEAESRPWLPHITLARLAASVPRDVVERFDGLRLPAGIDEMACSQFALYAGETGSEGSRYRMLESFPLDAAD